MNNVLIFILFSHILYSQNQTIENIHLHLEKSEHYFKATKYDSAYSHAKIAYDIANKLRDTKLKPQAALAISKSKIVDADEEFFQYLEEVIEQALHNKNVKLLADGYFVKGKMYYTVKDFGLALPYYIQVDSLSKKYNFDNETTIKAVLDRSEIARTNRTPEGRELAETLLNEALEKAKKENLMFYENLTYLYRADLEGLKGNYAAAKENIDNAFVYFKKEDHVRYLSRIYLLRTVYYNQMKQQDSAEISHKERIAYLIRKDDSEELAGAYIAFGSFHRRNNGDCNKALIEFSNATQIFEKIENKIGEKYLNLKLGIAQCLAELQDFENAYLNYQQAYTIRVELAKKNNNELTRNLETQYQTKNKEREIQLLQEKNNLEVKQKENQLLLFLGLLLIAGLTLLLLYFGYRNKVKTAKKIEELDIFKSNFFATISHELRTPLTLIKSPVQKLKSLMKDKEALPILDLVERNSDRMLALVNQMLDLSKLDKAELKLILKNENLEKYIKNLVAPFAFESKKKTILFKEEYYFKDSLHWFDKDVFDKIISNLLSNAIKYTPENETIAFYCTQNKDELHLKISNSGAKLSETEFKKIFHRFYQTDISEPGVGLGLSIVKELIKQYRGSIKTEYNNHTITFKVKLPLDPAKLKDISIITNTITKSDTIKKQKGKPEDKLFMLIIDDTEDIRFLLKQLFKETFTVLEAKNGKEGYKIAVDEVPDIIVSDVVMPVMDGIEMTKKLKQNEITSFIPIILLTAYPEDEAHIKALKAYADTYESKPFNNEILKAKVHQLIEERKLLRERFSQEIVIKPTNVVLNSVDERFLQKLQIILDKEIANAAFSTEDFAAEIGMSRMQLHRKLKSLTGYSAIDFFKHHRLLLAAQLLEIPKQNIAQVAYTTGFNDANYFAKCFKETFGESPSQYNKKFS
ncbi:MAG: response regulator [Flavobacteriales bacterium]|nr:response regulator [Flavobacteriales bacterium]